MSTLPPEPVIAVDSTAKPKEIREEGYVPQSVNGKEVHLGAASERSLRSLSSRARPVFNSPASAISLSLRASPISLRTSSQPWVW